MSFDGMDTEQDGETEKDDSSWYFEVNSERLKEGYRQKFSKNLFLINYIPPRSWAEEPAGYEENFKLLNIATLTAGNIASKLDEYLGEFELDSLLSFLNANQEFLRHVVRSRDRISQDLKDLEEYNEFEFISSTKLPFIGDFYHKYGNTHERTAKFELENSGEDIYFSNIIKFLRRNYLANPSIECTPLTTPTKLSEKSFIYKPPKISSIPKGRKRICPFKADQTIEEGKNSEDISEKNFPVSQSTIVSEGKTQTQMENQPSNENRAQRKNPEEKDNSDMEIEKPFKKIPIHIDIKLYSETLTDNLMAQLDIPIAAYTDRFFIRLTPQTEADYLATKAHLEQEKIPFYTLSPKDLRPSKFIINGLPANSSLTKIEEAIKTQGYKPLHLYQFKPKEKSPLPIFAVTLAPSETTKNFIHVKKLAHFNVRIKKYKSDRPKQCQRCFFFGHSMLAS